jgi:2-polyprenyl-3-methyl-5-hydroxy-6-metoxy-1,4-benzoquinol methylase
LSASFSLASRERLVNESDSEACPICRSPAAEFCRRNRFDTEWIIRKCGNCGHGFVSNRPTLARLSEIYATDVNPSMEEITAEQHEQRSDAITLTKLITRNSAQRGRSLDVGSGNGGFSYHLQKYGYSPTMIDLDPRAEPAAAIVPGSTFKLCPFEDIEGEGVFSAIIMSQVLEHALDPVDWLRRSRRLLTKDGVLAVAVPNFGGIYRVLGKKDPFLTPPIHLNFFTPRSMKLAMESAGLREVATRSQSAVAISPRLGVGKKLLETAWNPLSKMLFPTPWGIILISLAKPA